MHGLRLKILTISLISALPTLASAYYTPGVTVQASSGPYVSGWVDGLIPLYKNNQQMLFSDVQWQGSNTNAGILSMGGGYRRQINADDIVGAYLFYDRERSAAENYYNVISPGIEYITPRWHYRLNYYEPLGTKKYLNDSGLAQSFGNTQYETFQGHNGYDAIEYQYESLSYGADFNVGYRFQEDQRWEVDVTPYAFNQTNGNAMLGANTQLNFYKNNNTTVFVGDGYDNVNHNRVFVGVSFTLGGHDNEDSMNNLMMSPIYRNMDVNTTANSLPVDEYNTFSSPILYSQNLWFVNNSANGSLSNGTYENPYTNIYEVNTITDSQAEIRVASTGIEYGAPPGDGYGSPPEIDLSNDQTMTGYTSDYKTVTTGNDRPIIDASGGFTLSGNNTLTGLQIYGGNSDQTGVSILGNSTLNDMLVGTTDHAFSEGVYVSGGASATINNSVITAYVNETASYNTYGIKADINSDLTINSSTINATANGTGGSDADNAYGIYLGTNATSDVKNSTINSTVGDATQAYGVYFDAAGDTTVSNDTINVHGTNNGAGYGLVTNNYANTLVVDQANINVIAEGQAIGIELGHDTDSADSTISNSIINVTANDGGATGVYQAIGDGKVSVDYDQISVNGTSSAEGVYIASSSGDVDITHSTIQAVSTTGTSVGVSSYNNSGDMNVSYSTITASTSAENSSVYGVENTNSTGSLNIDHSTINATSNGSGSSVTGIFNAIAGEFSLSNSTVNATATVNDVNVVGVQDQSNSSNMTIENTFINATGINQSTTSTYGVFEAGVSGDVNIDSTTITVVTSWVGGVDGDPSAVGVAVQDATGTTIINNSTLNVTETGDNSTAAGIWPKHSDEAEISAPGTTFNLDADTIDDVWAPH